MWLFQYGQRPRRRARDIEKQRRNIYIQRANKEREGIKRKRRGLDKEKKKGSKPKDILARTESTRKCIEKYKKKLQTRDGKELHRGDTLYIYTDMLYYTRRCGRKQWGKRVKKIKEKRLFQE